MSNQKFTPVNEFVARGVVRSIGRSPYGGRMLRLGVKERRTELTLEIALNGNIANDIGRKDRVVVQGYVRAYTYHNDALNKDSEVMYFVATDVQKDVPELAQRFGIEKGNFYPEHLFRAFISGKITEISTSDNTNWAQLTLQTCGGGTDLRPSYVVIRYYRNNYMPVFDYEVGDIICTRCSAFTPEKKTPNGRTRIYQNLVAEDVAYLFKQNAKKEQPVLNTLDIGLPGREIISDEELELREAEHIADNESIFADDSALLDQSL